MHSHTSVPGTRTTLLALLLALLPCAASAQGLLALGVGGGAGLGSRSAGATGSTGHGSAFLQIKPPLLPGGRGEAMVVGGAADVGPIALVASAIVSAPIPIVTPYLVAGWGQYGVGKSTSRGGWNAGLGVHVGVPAIPGFFAEVRRHQRLGRTLATVGVTF